MTARRRATGGLAAALVVLGVVLRVAHPGAVDLDPELAARTEDSLAIVHGERLPLLGRELSGLLDRGRHGPAMDYLEALPFGVSRSPLTLPVWIALLHGVGIWALYRLGRETISPRCGLLAALWMAGDPFLGYWTRKTWNPSYLPLWTPLLLLLAWRAIDDRRDRWTVAFLAVFAVASQFHLLIWNLLPGAILAALLLRARPSPRALVLGACVVALAYAPLAIHGALGRGWGPLLGWLDLLRGGLGEGGPAWAHPLAPWGQLVEGSLMHRYLSAPPEGARAAARLAGTVVALLAAGAPVMLLGDVLRRGEGREAPARRGALFLLVMLAVQLVALVGVRTGFYPRYSIAVFPTLLVVLAAGLDRAARLPSDPRARRAAGAAVVAGSVALVVVQVGAEMSVLRAVERVGLRSDGRPTYRVQARIAEVAARELFAGSEGARAGLRSDTGSLYAIPSLLALRFDGEPAPRSEQRITAVLLGTGADAEGSLLRDLRGEGLRRIEVEPFELVVFPRRSDPRELRLRAHPEGAWWRPGHEDASWDAWYPDRAGTAADERVGARFPLRFAAGERARGFTLWSRACVERAWLDGRLVHRAACPTERSTVERPPRPTRLSLEREGPASEPHEALLALELVIRDKWYSLDFFEHPVGPGRAPAGGAD